MPVADEAGPRIDPVLANNFLITLVDSTSVLATARSAIQNVILGGFSECTGLEMSLQVEEYKEGGRNGAVLKFPTRVNWTNITFKRGITAANTYLWDWHDGFVRGRGKRRDGIIVLQDESRLPVAIWNFRRGFPVKWTGPSFNGGQNNVAIESLEIAHEGLSQVSLTGTAERAFG